MQYRYYVWTVLVLSTSSLLYGLKMIPAEEACADALPEEKAACIANEQARQEALKRALGLEAQSEAVEQLTTPEAQEPAVAILEPMAPSEEVNIQVEPPLQGELPSGILQRISEQEAGENPELAEALELGSTPVDEQGTPTVSDQQKKDCAATLFNRQRM